MKKITAIIIAVLLLLSAMLMTGCESMLDEYESDTFELGEGSTNWYDDVVN